MEYRIKGSVIYENKRFSSEWLNVQVERMKNILNGYTYGDDEVVAFSMKRSPLLFTLIFAMLDKGIAFLPIDNRQPYKRNEYMLNKAGVCRIFTDDPEKVGYPQIDITSILDETVRTNVEELNKNELAYILYTSGSTGKPKAVEVLRKGLDNVVQSIPDMVGLMGNEKMICLTNVNFDIFFIESVMALQLGMTVILAKEEERNNPRVIAGLIKKHEVDVIQMTPSALQMLSRVDSEYQCLKNVKKLLVAGESFPQNLMEKLQKKTKADIYNMYGPTETTIFSTLSELTNKRTVDIGVPIPHTKIFLLDDKLRRVKPNKEGEICISGVGVARGYRNDWEQTQNHFIELPTLTETKIYRTGDIGKYDKKGNLLCLGRKDQQIKLRGHRIELSEIDENLIGVEGIREAVTGLHNMENAKRLVSFYLSDYEVPTEKLKRSLSRVLPDYMIPQLFIRVPDFMYTHSGKTDRNRMIRCYVEDIEEIGVDGAGEEEEEYGKLSVEEVVVRCLNEVAAAGNDELTPETAMESLELDSLNYIDLIVKIEGIYNIEFEDNYLHMDSFRMIGDLVRYVEELRG